MDRGFLSENMNINNNCGITQLMNANAQSPLAAGQQPTPNLISSNAPLQSSNGRSTTHPSGMMPNCDFDIEFFQVEKAEPRNASTTFINYFDDEFNFGKALKQNGFQQEFPDNFFSHLHEFGNNNNNNNNNSNNGNYF